MAEETREQPPQSGGENRGVDDDVRGEGDEGARSAAATPPIGEDAQPGQTASPAPPDDVGVPPDEEMNQPDE
jgi:hypothetical protein